MRASLVIVIALCSITLWDVRAAYGSCGDESVICAAGSPWYEANSARLRFAQPGSTDYGEWNFSIPDRVTIAIDFDTQQQGKVTKGQILLVNGRVMLTKGFAPEKGYEIDALDGPVLYYQLVISLLSQAFPKGPENFKGTHTIKVREDKRGIRIATSSASGFYAPPWALTGQMQRKDDETIVFSLSFNFPAEKLQQTIAVDGAWKKSVRAPTLDTNMSLEGWNAYALGPISIKQEGSTILDYGAQSQPINLRTLGELQESLRIQEASSNNPPQPTR